MHCYTQDKSPGIRGLLAIWVASRRSNYGQYDCRWHRSRGASEFPSASVLDFPTLSSGLTVVSPDHHSLGEGSFLVDSWVPILALIAGLTGPICRALGLRCAALICAVLVLGLYWTLSFYLMIGFTTAGPLGLIYFWYLFFPPLIAAIATTISLARTAGPGWALGCVGVGSPVASSLLL